MCPKTLAFVGELLRDLKKLLANLQPEKHIMNVKTLSSSRKKRNRVTRISRIGTNPGLTSTINSPTVNFAGSPPYAAQCRTSSGNWQLEQSASECSQKSRTIWSNPCWAAAPARLEGDALPSDRFRASRRTALSSARGQVK